MKIIEFIIYNWSDILLVFSVFFLMIYSSFTNNLGYLRADLFSLVTEAEKIYGGKTGEIKLMYVVKKIHSKMPAVLKAFLSEKQLEKIIEKVLMKVKKIWSEKPETIESGESAWR